MSRELDYWKRRLDGAPQLDLVTDRVRPAVRRGAGDSFAIALGRATTRCLREVSRANGVTPFETLLAAWQLVLGRYAGSRDVSVGTPAGSGGDPLVIRTWWADDPTFAVLLGRVRETTREADEHRDVSFEQIVDALRPQRDLSRTPLFQAMLDLTVAMPEPAGRVARYDLTVVWDETSLDAGELRGHVEYDVDLFDRRTVERMTSHYLTLLDSALAAPGARVSGLAHTTPDELALLAGWGTNTSQGRWPNVVRAFSAHAEARPDAVALVFDDETISYAELRARSEHLAGLLVEHGVEPESVVGLAMERSAPLVVAMLAVLMAGAAYLPLDLDHPATRLGFMVADSEASLVLADRALDFAGAVPVLRIDELGTASTADRVPRASRTVHRDQRACVFYTSGSTGRPKGVGVTHRGIVRLVCDATYLGVGPTDVMAQVANVSFDAATLDVWGALLNGASTVGIRKDESLTPELLSARIEDRGITTMFLTTAVFNHCVDTAPAMFAPMRTILFGGEEADARRVAVLRAAVPGLRIVNGYGPTECTTFACTHEVVDAAADATRVPIGLPIPDTSLHVLDEFGQQVGIGVPGELHIGGGGLARGYVGRPGLTAERFVPSPFGVGERLYRTGDLVRRREDGTLEYLSRMDTQVKIRGVRIEPEEIASVLAACEDVRAAVVDVRGSRDAKRLVAYVVMADGRPVEPRQLRAHLAARLPEAMVPAWFVALPELPLTPNGKVDRRALPAPSERDGVRAEIPVLPRNATEELLAQIWAELLGVSEVSVHDDFFALGGHSLLATQMVARIAARLRADLGVRDLFEAPTIAGLAERMRTVHPTGSYTPVGPAGDGPHPLSFAQRRLWFLDQLAPGSPLYNIGLVLTVDGPLDVASLRESVRALTRRHASLRTRLVGGHDDPRQVIDEHTDVPVEVEDLRRLPPAAREREADALVQDEVQRPFDLATGPLLRIRLLRLDQERFVLALTMHHAISDGWSVGILLSDLGAHYASRNGAPPPIQYTDYTAWQRRHLASGAGDTQLAYWIERLAGAPPALDLPTDRPRPPVPRFAGDTFPLRLSPALTARLDEVSQAHEVTRFMTLLAALQLVLGRYAGVRDVSVGTPISGRVRLEFEELVGFFVNTMVLRTRWEDGLTFAGLLARVREATLGAYDHQDVPFEQVVEALKPPRDLSRTPLFQVMLAVQNVLVSPTTLPGLTTSVREHHDGVAKFDLTVVWDETPHESGELRGSVEYDVDLFDRETVERMMDHYLTLLDSALAAPQARVSSLAMASDAVLNATVKAPTAAPAPAATLHELVGAAAERWADRTALVQDGRSLSYAELQARSDAVCAYLRGHGVRAGSTVLVRVDRGLAWPAALLGIVKAGAAYVPMDPHTPRERLEHVLRDCGATLVLGSRAGAAPPSELVPFVAVEDAIERGAQAAAPAVDQVHPCAPAYVIYTSGTTGRPKGVCVSHANLTHSLLAVSQRYALTPQDRVLQFAALTFDVAAEELFASLISGATVVLLPTGPTPGIDELVSLARRERLSVLNLPASYWHEWVSVLATHPPSSCPALRLVVVGSERVDSGKLAEWQAGAPAQVRWLNAYGPTETTITATIHEPPTPASPTPSRSAGATVAIGRPLPGVRAYVLDAAVRPVPDGVPGELYIAGAGVSHGYLGDPARTALCFLPDPWGGPGDRMYATGDRARRTAGGVLEFLGRGDDQVKLRGFRIELGEIEAALTSHPEVRDAAAVLREDTPGKPQLVGYVTLAGPASTAQLRAHLADRLPGYMMPTAVVVVDEFPRGEGGKIDRRALPAPAPPVPGLPAGAASAAPTNEVEQAVSSIWRDILALEHVGADDNFFELGGHSLLIVRMQARLSEALDRKVPVVDLFRFPTVRTLARHLVAIDEAGAGAAVAGGAAGRRRAETRRTLHGARVPRRRASTTDADTTLETKTDD